MRTTARSFLLAFLIACASLAAGTPAYGAFSAPVSGTSTLTAGTHEDVTINIQFPDMDFDVEDMDIKLPPGLLGSPNAVTPCTHQQVQDANCPDSAQVGTTSVNSDIWLPGVLWGITLTDMGIGGKVYLMEPRGSEPARLYTQLGPYVDGTNTMDPIKLEVPVDLNSPGDYSLISPLRDLPLQNGILALGLFPTTGYVQLKSMALTLWGTRGHMAEPFLTSPTSCEPVRYKLSAKPYSSSTWVSSQSSPITVSGCESTPFDPTASISPSSVPANLPAGLSVSMGFPAPGSGTAQSSVKSAEFVLPEGFALSAGSGSAGLEACTDEQFAADTASAPSCPELSKVGSVSFVTPLVDEPVSGDVFIGSPEPGTPLRMLIYATYGSIHLKLGARAVPDSQTGQITTYFSAIPPIPFTSFTMTFRGGDNAVLKAPPTCGEQQALARLEPASRPGTQTTVSAPITTTDCSEPRFEPTLSASVDPAVAGGDTGMTMSFERSDADELFDGLKVSMPPGLLGRLTAVERCPLDSARAGNCPEAAKVGTVLARAGTGDAPLPIEGPVYLTEPAPGAVAGLAIIVPAAVGPIDLGAATVLASMKVRPDLGIDVVSDPMPRIVGGVPLFVRSMTLRLNREGFMFNASSCAEQAITATLTSTGGRTVTSSTPYRPTGCDALPFAPQFSAKLSGSETNPALTATMLPRPGDATMSSMRMTLPVGLGADMNALDRTCMAGDFAAGNCPSKSRIGTATAVSAILPEPMSGPVYLVQLPGETLPGLAVALSGIIDLPITIKNGFGPGNALQSTVTGIPDVPLSRFDLHLDGGGLLQAEKGLVCGKPLKIGAAFTAHNGAASEVTPTIGTDCRKKILPPKRSIRAKGSLKRGRSGARLRVSVSGKALTSARITLPKTLKLKPSRVRGAAVGRAGGRPLVRKQVSARGQSITLRVPASSSKRGVSTIALDLAPDAITARSLRRGKTVTVKVRTTHAGGGTATAKLKLRTR